MTREEAVTRMRALRKQGFDMCKGYKENGTYLVRVQCSQCQAAVITYMGTVACHETGCPNARRKRR